MGRIQEPILGSCLYLFNSFRSFTYTAAEQEPGAVPLTKWSTMTARFLRISWTCSKHQQCQLGVFFFDFDTLYAIGLLGRRA
jgi:hypothetical protein